MRVASSAKPLGLGLVQEVARVRHFTCTGFRASWAEEPGAAELEILRLLVKPVLVEDIPRIWIELRFVVFDSNMQRT